MQRRQFLASASLVAAAVATPSWAKVSPGKGARDAELRAMLDRFFYARLEDSPEQATSLGLDTGREADGREAPATPLVSPGLTAPESLETTGRDRTPSRRTA